MVIDSTFSIKISESTQNDAQVFEFIGTIDAHASTALDEFQSRVSASKVILNFAEVDRVNSMGLSLLLKLFEIWERQHIEVEVHNLNRMINMLFKITGLGRFLPGQKGSAESRSKNPTENPAPPLRSDISNNEVGIARESENATLKFMANLQTGQQISGWYMLNTYLQRRLQRAIHLEQPQFGQDIAGTSPDLLFSKPFEAFSMVQNNGFIPLLRPTTEADEVVILARSDDARSLDDFGNAKVVTASKSSFVYILGRSLCDESGFDSSTFDFAFSGNEIKGLQMLIKQQADLLFMLKKTYQGLSSFARNSIRLVDESETNFAYHLFCAAPYLKSLSPALSEVLVEMTSDDQGKKILEDIEMEGWCKPDDGELHMLQLLFNRYIAS